MGARKITVSAAAACALTAVADLVLLVTKNPDPGSWAYRAGYLVAPFLSALAICLAWLIVLAVSRRLRGRPRDLSRAICVGVVGTWALSLFVDVVASGQGLVAQAIVLAGLVAAAFAMARLALDAGTVADRSRRRLWIPGVSAALATLLVVVLVISPSGLRALRAGTGPCPDAGAPLASGQNVLLLSVDSLRRDEAVAMKSYALLAARGREYTAHVATSPWTLPSIATMLTGVNFDVHGAGTSRSSWSLLEKTSVPSSVPSLAGELGARGYRTHAIVTNPFLTSLYGIDRGFCAFENVTMEGETMHRLAATSLGRVLRVLAPRLTASDRADTVRQRAEAWLATHDAQPFFLWLHFLDPHAPYGDLGSSPTSLALDLLSFEATREVTAPFSSLARIRAGELRPDDRQKEVIRGLYRDDVAFVDQQIAALLTTLEARGLLDRTAIVLTADHGEEFWDHGGVEHGRTLFDEVLRVPLVIVDPRTSTASRSTAMTSHVDLAEMVLALASPGAAGSPEDAHDVRAEPVVVGNLLFGEEATGVRTDDAKLIRTASGQESVFLLDRDPQEKSNALGAVPPVADTLRQWLDEAPLRVARAHASAD